MESVALVLFLLDAFFMAKEEEKKRRAMRCEVRVSSHRIEVALLPWLNPINEELNVPIVEKYYEHYGNRPIFNGPGNVITIGGAVQNP